MSAPRYAVETVGASVCVLAESEGFCAPLIRALIKEGIETTQLTPSLSSSQLFEHSDIVAIFLTPTISQFLIGEGRELWHKLSQPTSPKLVIVQKSWLKTTLTFPNSSTHIYLGEYLGFDQLGSPTLISITSAIAAGGSISLGGGGIPEFSLMSEEYLANSLAHIILQLPRQSEIYLSNPDSTSLLNLFQHIPSQLHYSESGILPIPVSDQSPSDSLSSILTTSCPPTLVLAQEYIINQKPIEPPPIADVPPKPIIAPRLPPLRLEPSPEPPRSHPRNLSNLEFVPLKTPKRRLAAATRLRLRGLRVVARGFLLGIILYLGSLALALGITYVTLQNLQSRLASQQLDNLPINSVAKFAGKYLYSNSVAWGMSEATNLLDAYNQALKLGETAQGLSQDIHAISDYILGDSSSNLAASLSSARLATEDLYQQLSLLDGTLPPATPKIVSNYDTTYQSLKSKFPSLKKHLLLGKGVFSVLPEVIGLGTRAKYAVLFQNNMEIRGTGGFIGSFAILSFENGKLYDLTIYDVYAADGQLKGHVEPPAPIKDILGEAKWYLRDSNFDPDFPTSARRAEWFLKKSMNLDVSGTAAINLETLKGLLKAVGPLSLPDYNETVTAENLTERAQYHAEVNFFPGSTAKKEFLSSVADALFAKLKEGGQGNLLNTIVALTSSLESNDLQLSSLNSTTESVLQTLGWNGQIENKPCPTSPCYADFLYTVDSNFGVNKANFYVSKATNLNIVVNKEGTLENTLTTTWDNKATSNAWPAGSYKNYFRTYLPNNVEVTGVKIGERSLTSTEYTVASEHGHIVVSYLITIPINSQLSSTITYRNLTPLKSGILYSLYYQKQSGVNLTDPLNVSISYPLYLKPTQISPAANLLPQQLNFGFTSDTDHRISIQF